MSTPPAKTRQLAPKPRRKREEFDLTTRLRAMARYLRCPGLEEKNLKCGKPFGRLEEIEFDHIMRDELSGGNGVENCRPICKECHRIKTYGVPATTAGSDIHMAAKAKRIQKKHAPLTAPQEAFRARLLSKAGVDTPEEEKPSRGKFKASMPCGRGSRFKKKMDGKVVPR